MGLFDVFKSEPLKLTPRLTLAVSLLFMMAADGGIEEEEIGQLQSVLGDDADLIDMAIKYVQSHTFDQYLAEAPGILSVDQKTCLMINVCDSLLADGVAAEAEQTMFHQMLGAMGISQDDFRTHFQTIALKNNRQIFN
jgi:uncharacterized tellurite resistance protein B-like protein